jgi:hypothetical protein
MTLGTYRQKVSAIGLSIERGTESVPDDGHYHVLLDGREVFASSSEREALSEYRRLRDAVMTSEPRRDPASVREALRREMADRQAASLLAESARLKRAKATKKGGKGGSGGVRA